MDWSKVNAATGPLFVEEAEPGDTVIVNVLEIEVEDSGVIVTVPKYGILGGRPFNPSTRIVKIQDGFVHFDESVLVRASPMIGTIGLAPESGEVPCGSLGRHGGNMDVKELTTGVKLYLPVYAAGGLLAAGDLHAVQADGEFCVSSVEVAGSVLLEFNLIKRRRAEWPILEGSDSYAILTCGDTLEEAATLAADAAVKALMREHGWSFEEAYMFGSLAVDLRINQVVDPRKGVRAVISKGFISLDSLLAQP